MTVACRTASTERFQGFFVCYRTPASKLKGTECVFDWMEWPLVAVTLERGVSVKYMRVFSTSVRRNLHSRAHPRESDVPESDREGCIRLARYYLAYSE